MKGFRPTEDPGWRHNVHTPTGEVRKCERCPATFPIFCHGGHRRYCDQCAHAVKRVRDRAWQKDRRFIEKWKAADRLDLIEAMAREYVDTGCISYGWNDHGYGVKQWRIITAEAVALGLEMLADEAAGIGDDEEYDDEQADAGALAETERLLTEAQAAIAKGDLQAARIISERISRLSPSRA